jgi:hypothetical protein
MGEKVKIFEGGMEKHSLGTVLFANVTMIIMLALGTYVCWLYSLYLSVLYLGIFAILLYFVLRKLVCATCYYYDKWCGIGWGKLSAKLFTKGSMENFGKDPILKVAR